MDEGEGIGLVKTVALSFTLSLLGVIVAEVTPSHPGTDWVNTAFNGGAFGLLTYLVVYGLPKLYADIRTDRDKALEQLKHERHDDRNIQQVHLSSYLVENEKLRQHAASEAKYEREQSERHHEKQTQQNQHLVLLVESNQKALVEMLAKFGETLNIQATVVQRLNRMDPAYQVGQDVANSRPLLTKRTTKPESKDHEP